ncbi:hypothetical protein WR25_06154 [Diploscapter pachys]|uniref:Phospholipid scramblase n=1 Tax=Diploscapter pachys TaxID=2018661 RepID=A0A2A2KQT3_9BILA|nr:hypothetical protein WR25_06154 [Diploscapter pachys]
MTYQPVAGQPSVVYSGQMPIIYYAAERSDCFALACFGSYRGFTMHEVITVTRPFKCCTCDSGLACSDCCRAECIVATAQGVIARVLERQSCCSPEYSVKMTEDNYKFKITGPCDCKFLSCGDKKFEIYTSDGNYIGAITKKWRGFCVEWLTDADLFKVTFPLDLKVTAKAALIGATFLIDFMHFEQPNQAQRRNQNY